MNTTVKFSPDHALPDTLVNRPDAFDYLMQVSGQPYRTVARRATLKIRLDDRSYFIKRHEGVGWLELCKNWLTGKRPVVSARNEVAAIQALQQLAIPTTPYVAHGEQGWCQASIRSFVLTEDLGDIVTLEELALQWQHQRPSLRYKRALIRRVADIARQLHTHGLYHRDFYICHFCFKREEIHLQPPKLHVLDLHRAEIRATPSTNMQMKDMAALYFSAMDAGLSLRDKLAFMQVYKNVTIQALRKPEPFDLAIERRALQLYRKFQRKIRAGIKM